MLVLVLRRGLSTCVSHRSNVEVYKEILRQEKCIEPQEKYFSLLSDRGMVYEKEK